MKKILFTLIASMIIGGTIVAQELHWTVDPIATQYANNMSIVGYVTLNGSYVENTNFEVAAFVGDEVRYAGYLVDWGAAHPYLWASIPYESGTETFTFKLYDHNTNTEYDYCTTTITTKEDGYGSILEPLVVDFFTTFEKPITAWTTNGNYYLIASPIGQVSPVDVNNMIPGEGDDFNYDLYAFDQNASDGLEWRNYKNNAFENLEAGKGYLYANSTDVTLLFIGAAYSGDGKVTLVKNAESNPNGGFEGWNLVGNPFAQKASFTKEFYTMKEDGTEIIPGTDKVVEAMEGLFVIAANDGEEMTFTPVDENTEGSKGLVFNLKQGSAVVDRAIVRLAGSDNLPKLMLNPANTKLYIPQTEKDYAVMGVNRDTESMPLSLKVAENGTYTLSVTNEEDNLEYLTLMDHKTGMQVNLLVTPNYQFSASTNDAADRFTVFFRSTTGIDEQSSHILFRENGLLTVSGLEGSYELQVVDVLGRILSSTTVNGEYSQVLNVTPGLYTIRLVTADNTYTKKVVVD